MIIDHDLTQRHLKKLVATIHNLENKELSFQTLLSTNFNVRFTAEIEILKGDH